MAEPLFELINFQPETTGVSRMPPPDADDPRYITPKPKHRRKSVELEDGQTITMSAIAADELHRLKKSADDWEALSIKLVSLLQYAVEARNNPDTETYKFVLSRFRASFAGLLAGAARNDFFGKTCADAHSVAKEFYGAFLDDCAKKLNDDPTGEKHLAIAQNQPTPPPDLKGEPLPHPNWDRDLGGYLFERKFKRGTHYRKTYLYQCHVVDGEERLRFLGEKK